MSAPEKKITTGRLMDLSTLLVAFETFRVANEESEDPEVLAHLNKGHQLLLKRADELRNGIENYIYPLMDLNIKGVDRVISRHMMLMGKLSNHTKKTANLLYKVYAWLDKHTAIRDQALGTGKPRQSMISINHALKEDEPAARLHKLARVSVCSGLTLGQTWVKEATALAGMPLSEVEDMTVDVESAQELGKKIGEAKRAARLEAPNSPEAVEKEEEVAVLERAVEAQARASRNPGAVRLTSAAASLIEDYTAGTRMAKKLGLSRAQEKAMLVTGKSIIAAGAGSGKTRVLAGKVVHHIIDEGVPIESMIATSFSGKSAAELKKRIKDYGVDTTDARNIGTTHSLGNQILQQYDAAYSNKDIIDPSAQSRLIRMAMAQIRMTMDDPSKYEGPPNPEESIFPNIAAKGGGGVDASPEEGSPGTDTPEEIQEFRKAMRGVYGYWTWMHEHEKGVYGRLQQYIGDYPDQVLDWMDALADAGATPSTVTAEQKKILNELFLVSKDFGRQIGYRIASTPLERHNARKAAAIQARADNRGLLAMLAGEMDEDEEFLAAFAAELGEDEAGGPLGHTAAAPRKDKDKEKEQQASAAWYKTPANQWFNLGWPTVTAGTKKKGGAESESGPPPQQKVGPSRYSTAMSKSIGQTKSVGECYAEHIQGKTFNGGRPYLDPKKGLVRRRDGSKEEAVPFEAQAAAIYAAYKWLKTNATEFVGRIDFEDMQVRTCALMIHNPDMLSSMKSRYSHILVDEAQDLNQLQHTMFGLIAGYVDPATQKPYGDGRMSAKVYTLIGDDKQAIYAFRGADPEEFIRRSDMGEDQGEFKTTILETNYRSGGMIVGAANNLMAHNVATDKVTGKVRNLQIPMICNVLQSNEGQGVIEAERVTVPEEAASRCADTIQGMLESGTYDLGPDGNTPSFGIALRTNAEAYNYAVELVKKGIPFRTKIDVFGNHTTKTVLQYLQLSSSTDVGVINDAVTNLIDTPNMFLGAAFKKLLKEVAKGNYYDWLVANHESFPFKGYPKQVDFKRRMLGHYVDNLRTVREKLAGIPPTEFLDRLFQLEGFEEGSFNKVSFKESLMEYIRQNESEMDALSKESEDDTGEVDEAAIEAKAMAPLSIVLEVLRTHGDIPNAMAYVEKLQKLNDKSKKKDNEGDNVEPAVLIGTAHGWKGLECKNLFTQMAEGIFPSGYAEDDYEMAQERRLAYVVMTRGKENVTVYAPRWRNVGQSGDPDKELPPSRFIGESCIPGMPPGNPPASSASARDVEDPDDYQDYLGDGNARYARRRRSRDRAAASAELIDLYWNGGK